MLVERKKCPACSNKHYKMLYSIPYKNNDLRSHLLKFYSEQGNPKIEKLDSFNFELAECLNCKFIYQLNIPDDDFLLELYTVWINEAKVFEKYERFRSLYKINSYNSLLLDVILYLRRRDIDCFDYGFGYCHLLIQAQLLGMNTYGTEINPLQIDRAEKIGIKVIDFNEHSLPKMDVIFCEQVLEHAVHPREILEQIVKISREGTILHISVPNAARLKQTIKRFKWSDSRSTKYSWMPFQPLEHINCFENESLVKLLSDFNFRVANIKHGSLLYNNKSNFWSVVKLSVWLIWSYVKANILRINQKSTDLYFVYSNARKAD
jgi:2-polyprenyl-3-methyl-5-hydroxy-6-metoxy-1,4-benzoquinol methylase